MNLKTIRRFIENITYCEALRVYRCSKAFSVMAWDWQQNQSLRFVSCVFPVWCNRRCRRLTKLQVNTKNQITPKQTILATDFQWIFKEHFSFKFRVHWLWARVKWLNAREADRFTGFPLKACFKLFQSTNCLSRNLEYLQKWWFTKLIRLNNSFTELTTWCS